MNKKILSIFALIMALSFAVSCSNSDTTGTGNNNNQTKPALDIALSDAKYSAQDTTDLFFITTDGSDLSTAEVTLPLSGTDYAADKLVSDTTKDKIQVTIKAVKGLKDSEVTATNPSGQSSKTTKVDLSTVTADQFELTGLGTTAKLKVKDDQKATIAGLIGTSNDFGMIYVTLTFHDNNGTKADKDLSFYVCAYY